MTEPERGTAERPTNDPPTDREAPAAAAPAGSWLPYSLLGDDAPPPLPAAILGEVVGLDPSGRPLVRWPGAPDSDTPARQTSRRSRAELERAIDAHTPVLLVFEAGDPTRPIITGWIDDDAEREPRGESETATDPESADVRVDGRSVSLEGAEEVELRCGAASIRLRKDGRVEIEGKYVISRSSGPHKIKGGTVEIN